MDAFSRREEAFESQPPSSIFYTSLFIYESVYRETTQSISNFNSISMKYYAVIHAVTGLFEGYSDTSCNWFPTKEAAQKHIDQHLGDYREDEMCVNIDHSDPDSIYVTMDRDPDNYAACVPSDMSHDDYVAEHGDDVSVEVFRIVEVDASRYEGSGTTEHMWLTWDQLDACVAWDYFPLYVTCSSCIIRCGWTTRTGKRPSCQLGSSSRMCTTATTLRPDDYSMHAFRIPKPKNSDSYDQEETA